MRSKVRMIDKKRGGQGRGFRIVDGLVVDNVLIVLPGHEPPQERTPSPCVVGLAGRVMGSTLLGWWESGKGSSGTSIIALATGRR